MMKKILAIFGRDVKVNKRDFLALYIILFPILFAIAINLISPSVNDTTVNLVLIEGENTAQIEYFEQFAKIDIVKDEEALIERVSRRDAYVGVLPSSDGYYILAEGNEGQELIDFSKILLTMFNIGADVNDSSSEIHSFGRTVSPLKQMLVNTGLIFTSILGGMLIAINIVEEKVDKTIRAMHVTPISRLGFLLGKSSIGLLLPIYGGIAIILLTGFTGINYGQMLLLVVVSSILSMLVGLIEGLSNDDVMNAAANIKILFLPLAASIAGLELLSDKWQPLFWWSPFYWAYKGNKAVLAYDASWSQVLLYGGIVLLLSGIVYLYLAPKIRKGLE